MQDFKLLRQALICLEQLLTITPWLFLYKHKIILEFLSITLKDYVGLDHNCQKGYLICLFGVN